MSAAVHELPGSAACKVKQPRHARSATLASVPSLTAYRSAREAIMADPIKQMESALHLMLGAVASGNVTGLAFIVARGANDADSVAISGSFVSDFGHLQRCLDAFSTVVACNAAVRQS